MQSLQRAASASSGRAGGEVSLASSALWLVIAKTAAAAFNIAVPLLLVRLLTVREFGVYKQLFLLLDTALVILPLGFALSAFYFFPREPSRKAQIVGHIVLVYVLVGGLGALLVAGFPALPAALLNTRDLAAYAPILGLAMVLWVGSSFIEFVAIANGEARLAALVVLGMQLLRSGLLVAAGAVFASVRALAVAAVVCGVLQSAVVFWYVRTRFSDTRQRVDWGLMRAQLVYALPLAYAGLFWWLQGFVHHYFVSYRFGAAAYAVYAVGCFQLPIVNIVHESVGSVVIRRVSELRRLGETRELVRLATQTVRTLAAFAFPVYALLLVTGREFITVLFTRQYLASWPIFAVNLTLIPLAIVAPICDAVFRACPEELPFSVAGRPVDCHRAIQPGRCGGGGGERDPSRASCAGGEGRPRPRSVVARPGSIRRRGAAGWRRGDSRCGDIHHPRGPDRQWAGGAFGLADDLHRRVRRRLRGSGVPL